jgi:UDP-glucuronate decarboxylase
MARVLVTGGAGFLGSHLCERLLREGHNVLCVDNYVTGRQDNIIRLLHDARFESIQHDVTSPLHVEVDEIYNLACPASPIHYQFEPVQTVRTCVYGAINVLELAKRVKAKVFQASTSEIYGDPQMHPQSESYWGHVNPIGTRSCYDEGKRCAETIFFDYYRQYGLRIKVARIFNTYGPRMSPNDGRIIANFIVQALKGEPITIYGDGMQTRCFCYVDDQIEGWLRLMDSADDLTGPINLGATHETTVLELAQMILDLTGSRSTLVWRSLPADDPHRRCPDITLAKEKLTWQTRISLKQGLTWTINYFESLLSKGRSTMPAPVPVAPVLVDAPGRDRRQPAVHNMTPKDSTS